MRTGKSTYTAAALLTLLFATLIARVPSIASGASRPVTYTPITSSSSCPALPMEGKRIDFDDGPGGTDVTDRYRHLGVRFIESHYVQPRIEYSEFGDGEVDMRPAGGWRLSIRFATPQRSVGFALRNMSDYNDFNAAVSVLGNFGRHEATTELVVASRGTRFTGFSASDAAITTIRLETDGAAGVRLDDLCFGTGSSVAPVASGGVAPAHPIVHTLPDLTMRGFEVTQGTQCWDDSQGAACGNNTVPLVTDKTTMIRLYGKTSGTTLVSNVPYRVYITANGTTYQMTGSGPAMPFMTRSMKAAAKVLMKATFNSAVNLDMYAVIDPDNKIPESNESNNRIPATGTVRIPFRPTPSRTILARLVDYNRSTDRKPAGAAVNGTAVEWFETLAPSSDHGIDYDIASGELEWTAAWGEYQAPDLVWKLTDEWWLNLMNGAWQKAGGAPRNYYGWVSGQMAADGAYLGMADIPATPATLAVGAWGADAAGAGPDHPGFGDAVFGHEVSHNYGLRHVATSDSCGSESSAADWPYKTGSIQEFGVNTMTSTLYSPSETHDLMSYCPPDQKKGWISPFHWEKLLNEFTRPIVFGLRPVTPAHAVGRAASAELSPGETLGMSFTIDTSDRVTLHPAYRVPSAVPLNSAPDSASPYAVELRAGSSVLLREPVHVSFASEGQGSRTRAQLRLALPYDARTTSIAVTKGAATLAERVVSASKPQLAIAPLPSSFAPGSSHTIAWSGADADGDALTYHVLYSIDGSSWQPLALDLTTTSFAVETDTLAGSQQARFRVMATDGVNTTIADSDYVEVPDQLPLLEIIAPVNGARAGTGVPITFIASATDREEGSVPGSFIEWRSDRHGSLGSGETFTTDALTPGRYTISARAYELNGRYAERSITVDVIGLSPPVMSPAPSAVNEPAYARATLTTPASTAGLTCTVDYGTGRGDELGFLEGSTCTGPTHGYSAVETYPVLVKVFDGENVIAASTAPHRVVDVTAPVVSFTWGQRPGVYLGDTLFVAGGPERVMVGAVTIEATATDPESPVAKMEFIVDGRPATNVRYDADRRVYSFVFRSPFPGFSTIVARATNTFDLSSQTEIQVLGLSP